MGAFVDYIHSRKYKVWKPVYGRHLSGNIVIKPSEISPVAGSKIKIFETIELFVVDDGTGLGGNFYMYFYLYDFIKEGQSRYKSVTVKRREKSTVSNKFYDDSLEYFLGGDTQRLGG